MNRCDRLFPSKRDLWKIDTASDYRKHFQDTDARISYVFLNAYAAVIRWK